MDLAVLDIAVVVVVLALIILKLYLKLGSGVCKSQKDMTGMTVLITGANSGIGLEAARNLANRNARVILACRSEERGLAAAQNIRLSTDRKTGDIVVRHLDLSSLKSVRMFCENILDTEQRIDVVINNAGMTPEPGHLNKTDDGLELQFASNHFGHFLMTCLLLDLLKKSGPSRIVVVSSVTHWWASLDVDNLNCEKHYRDPYWVYCSTKLANLLFAKELSRRLQGTGVTVNAVHPGAVCTNIVRNGHWFVRYLIYPAMYPFAKSSREGAETVVHLAVSEDVEGISGEYFVDCRKTATSWKAQDKHLAEKLWEKSEQATGLSNVSSSFGSIGGCGND